MKTIEISLFLKDLLEAKSICLLGHGNPDGDCIMSMMALYEYLRLIGKGKNVTLYLDGEIPYNYEAFVDKRIISRSEPKVVFDLAVIFDCANIDRLGGVNIIKYTFKTYAIDHHHSNTLFADINFVDTSASSTGEVLYSMLKDAKQVINKRMAECFYITILTDTEKFMKNKTTANTHKIIAELMVMGIDIFDINKKVYQSRPHGVALAQAACMVGIKFYYDGKLGVVKVTQNIAQSNNGKIDEIDGLIDWLCEIKNVEIGCVLREYEDQLTRVSLRARNAFNILSIAQKFNGGGHWDSVGFVLNESIYEAEGRIIDEFESMFRELEK